ncbi:MAG TPA: thiamine pyrophosphate-binding protein [Ramlibacter sp.]|nr:thiamine pyrophosphate-binding protein [Ramlibacter sp.]
MTTQTVIDVLAQRLAARGVKRFFGVPGGDCSLDLIDACARAGIEVVLTRDETAAAMAACVTGELTGAPGVIMLTRGPGLANAINGIAYAALDRAPLLVLADGYDPQMAHVSHQRYDQHALLKPLVKGSCGLKGKAPGADIDALLDLACADPPGPVYIEMLGSQVRASAPSEAPPVARALHGSVATQLPAGLEDLIASAQRPLIVAGMQASGENASNALRALVEQWNCPVLHTYKSLGAVSGDDPRVLGFYNGGGVAEQPIVSQADLIVLFGLDAIEFPPHKFLYTAPVIEFTTHPFERNVVEPKFSLAGDLAAAAQALQAVVKPAQWSKSFFAEARAELERKGDAGKGEGPITPQQLVDAVIAAAPDAPHTRICIDAGAHMLPVLHSWHATEARQSLISRGLASMGFALPAAIASSLAQPDHPVIAFTGDGGLMMCMGELGTAVQYGCKMVVVVFNDASLTLISARQKRRKLPNAGVDFSKADFAQAANGFGALGIRVEQPQDLAPAFKRAFAHPGVALVDVVVNPDAYREQLLALRG